MSVNRKPALSLDEAKKTIEAIEAAVAAGAKWPLARGEKGISAIAIAADSLKINRASIRNRLLRAAELYGLAPCGIALPAGETDAARAKRRRIEDAEERLSARRGELGTKPVLPGFEINQTSIELGPDGETLKEWIKQRPAAGDVFEVPDGHIVKGVSALVDGDGREIAKWVKTRNGDQSGLLLDAIKAGLEPYRGGGRRVVAPKATNSDLLTFYPIADLHLGLYAWAAEAGADYDLEIAERLLLGAVDELVDLSPPSETAIVLDLGDFLHGDNQNNRTEKSGHALDIDTRYPKVLKTGVSLKRRVIERARERHKRVIYRGLPGNHDPNSAAAITAAMSCFFDRDPRVIVDDDPSLFFWHKFGKNLFFGHHGHELTPANAPGYMAATRPRDWGETLFRHAFFGHLHHKAKGGGEGQGVIWEIFQTLAAKDAWHAGKGFLSGRSMSAITYHKEHGEHVRFSVPACKILGKTA